VHSYAHAVAGIAPLVKGWRIHRHHADGLPARAYSVTS
jgi:hypothetical protein